tara:strand:+ start:30833 stop:31744 length:912 start_codon:yes stop_codon:yes gene_type:complete
MRIVLALILIFLTLDSAKTQVLAFDELEMRYDQGHYKNVYRKARRLLDKPQYDFSYLPEYYIALTKLQLAQNDVWLKRHKYAIVEAKRTFEELQSTHEGRDLLKSHEYEISSLKNDLRIWLGELKLQGKKEQFELVNNILNDVFDDVPNVMDLPEDRIDPDEQIQVETSNSSIRSDNRTKVLEGAEKLLGVPYKWAGNDPSGFDCSGFTCYVFENQVGKKIDRRAADQYKSSTKIKRKHVKPGDLIFFKNGSSISHVGIVFSTNNNSIQMIHASTSVGISIVDIYQSSYWKQRIAGFGTYLDD